MSSGQVYSAVFCFINRNKEKKTEDSGFVVAVR